MKTLPFILCGSLVAMLSSGAFGSVLYSSDFDANSLGALTGQAGSNGGTSGNWSAVGGGNGTTVTVVNSTGNYDLTYNVVGGGTIAGGAHSIDWAAPTLGNKDTISINLGTAITGQSFYARILMRSNTVTNAGSDLLFDLGSPAQATSGFGMYNKFGQAAFQGVFSGGADQANSNVNIATAGATNLIVAEFVWSGTQYNSAKIWVNPAYGDSGSPLASTSNAIHPFTTISTVGLIDSNLSGGSDIAIDSLAIGTTWADVVPVPEPSTYALFAAGGLVVLLAARRRKIGEVA